MKKEEQKNTYTLELDALKKVILFTCSTLNRPIRKSHLIEMIKNLFEYNTRKEVEFAILNLLEEKKLLQINFFIVTPELNMKWDKVYTNADSGIMTFLLSIKEAAKHDLFFDVYAPENLTPSLFFKYVKQKYPALLNRQDAALAFMEQMENVFDYALTNDFYAEYNDYPTNRWLTNFLNNPDCRLIIKQMEMNRNHANIQIVLIPAQKGKNKYKQANEDFEEFESNIKTYFKEDVILHIRKSLVTIKTSNKTKR